MTLLQEFIQKSSQLPKDIFDKHFTMPKDYSKEPCIHHDDYDYYPESGCIIMEDIPLIWDEDKDDIVKINLHNQEHIKELTNRLKEILKRNQTFEQNKYLIAYWNSKDDSYSVDIHENNDPHRKTMARKKNMKQTTLHNVPLYYEYPRITFKDKPWLPLLLECIVLAHLASPHYIIPYKNMDPSEWEGGPLNG